VIGKKDTQIIVQATNCLLWQRAVTIELGFLARQSSG